MQNNEMSEKEQYYLIRTTELIHDSHSIQYRVVPEWSLKSLEFDRKIKCDKAFDLDKALSEARAEFNTALLFAQDIGDASEAMLFLELWSEGAWKRIDKIWPGWQDYEL